MTICLPVRLFVIINIILPNHANYVLFWLKIKENQCMYIYFYKVHLKNAMYKNYWYF